MTLSESNVATYSIYVLKNPTNNEVFYVGKTTKELKMRLSGHLSDSGNDNPKGKYIKNLFDQNLKPIIEAVEVIYGVCLADKLKAGEREYYWIKHFKELNAPLTNSIGLEPDASCNDYQRYLRLVQERTPDPSYYYCGKTIQGIAVYDEERLNDDGFVFKRDEPDEQPEKHTYKETWTYEKIYDDENDSRGSFEER